VEAVKPHRGRDRTRNTNTMKIGELWGTKSTQKFVAQSEMTKAVHQIKFERWKEERRRGNLRGSPHLPHLLNNFQVKTPDLIGNIDTSRYLRVYSPQVGMRQSPSMRKLKKIDVINEIIKNCQEFKEGDTKMTLKIKEDMKNKGGRKKLSKCEIKNIEKNKKILDHAQY
jgi:hypothetical protein